MRHRNGETEKEKETAEKERLREIESAKRQIERDGESN
jgi:hypothetical protein